MGITKTILCLANSRKINGRCIAGLEIEEGRRVAWIRPVSSREHEEVSEHERQYENGSDPRILDLMEVSLLEPRPKGYQQENWLLDPTEYWQKVGTVPWANLAAHVDPVEPLWIDGESTYHGVNDIIPESKAGDLRSSLRLITVPHLELAVFKPGEAFGNPKRRVQARFEHAGSRYRIWVTDPTYERHYLALPDGKHSLGEAYITVSLGEPYNGACYKLAASIIEPPTT